MKNIYLIGFMGSGKTSAGRALAKKLGLRFSDTDLLIEKLSGLTAAGFIKKRGLRAWRKAENSALRAAAGAEGRVIALGGGIMPTKALRPLFRRSGVTVYLECCEGGLFKRLAGSLAKRPLLGSSPAKAKLAIAQLLKRRRPYYEKADLKINTCGLTPAQTADRVAKMLEQNENRTH
jgi:shikimate kinase